MGLGESIKRDHDEYRRFFAKMSKTTLNDGELRASALKEIMRKLRIMKAEPLFFLG